jgi:hypothetical protein
MVTGFLSMALLLESLYIFMLPGLSITGPRQDSSIIVHCQQLQLNESQGLKLPVEPCQTIAAETLKVSGDGKERPSFHATLAEAELVSNVTLPAVNSVICRHYGDLSAYCMYERSLCLMRNELKVVHDLKSGSVESMGDLSDKLIHMSRDETLHSLLPYRSFVRATYMHSAEAFAPDVQWLDGITAVTGFDATNHNLFHFATSMMNFLSYQLRENENSNSSLFQTGVFFHRNSDVTDWQRNLMQVVLGKQVVAYFDNNRPAMGSKVCFRRAVVAGQNLNMFQGTFDSYMFRKRLSHTYTNVSFHRSDIVFFRRDETRRIVNGEQVLNLLQKSFIGMPVKTVTFWKETFSTQLHVMSSAAVCVSTHGANLVHAIYMPAGAVVVEIVGRLFNYPLFERISLNSGLFHFRYTARGSKDAAYVGWSTTRCFADHACAGMSKGADLTVDIPNFAGILAVVREIVL